LIAAGASARRTGKEEGTFFKHGKPGACAPRSPTGTWRLGAHGNFSHCKGKLVLSISSILFNSHWADHFRRRKQISPSGDGVESNARLQFVWVRDTQIVCRQHASHRKLILIVVTDAAINIYETNVGARPAS
jgi:hypothetical protein